MSKRIFFRPTNRKIKKLDLYGFDVETYGEDNKFLMGSVVNDKHTYVFWNKREMIDFMLYNYRMRNCYYVATNLGFDFLALFGEFDDLVKFNLVIRGSDFVCCIFKNHKQKYSNVFLDSMNFYKRGVANIGKIIGIDKLEKPDFIGQKPKNVEESQYLEKYNIQDSLITYKFMVFLQDSFFDIEAQTKYTIASTSLNLFKNKYLKQWILQPEKDIIKKQFLAYYGGRCENFYRGKIENLKMYDINSLYPYVMSSFEYPNPNTMIHEKFGTIHHILKYHGISKCIVNCPIHLDIPLLPLRTKTKLVFPTGIFEGWYSHVELRKAMELGYRITPTEVIYYTQSFNPFKEFVNDLYSKRMKYKKEGSSLELVYKILLNSLYGKFAQKLEQNQIFFPKNKEHKEALDKIFSYNDECIKSGKKLRFDIQSPDDNHIDMGDHIISDPRILYVVDNEIEKYPKFINPILSLYTTAYARLELFKWIEQVHNKNGNVFYVDTDSIMTDIELPTSNELGGLKLEYDIKKGILIKPKLYYMDTEEKEIFKTKGLMDFKTYEDFEKLLFTNEYEYMKFTKFRESLRLKKSFNQKEIITKHISFFDDKRIWHGKFNPKILQKSKPLRYYNNEITYNSN